MTEKPNALHIKGPDGIVRGLDEHYDTPKDIEQDPYGAHLAIQDLWEERERLRAALKIADDNLTNLQPKIANGLVHEDWIPVFDGYIDPVLDAAHEALRAAEDDN